MSSIHYFPRYSQKENLVTNSTMLLLSRLYHYHGGKFARVLSRILEDEKADLDVGVRFGQQEKGKEGIADGVISQASFQVFIETKLHDNFLASQLKRHIEGFNPAYQQHILLALSKSEVDDHLRKKVTAYLKESDKGTVTFASTTYADIIRLIRAELAEYEVEMNELVDDFEAFCQENQLLALGDHRMLAVTAGKSLPDNRKWGIYYDPANRRHNLSFTYLGLYKNKAIRAIGKVKKTVYCDYVDGDLVPTRGEKLDLTTEERQTIIETIEQTDYYNLERGEKFILVDKFYETEFKGTTRGKRYFLFSEMEGYEQGMGAEDIAEWLRGKSWE